MISTPRWNVAVIGGGPGGALAALLLARAGLRVALIERSTAPRYKVCGGCLNERGLSILNECGLGETLRSELTAPLRRIVFHKAGRNMAIAGQVGAVVNRATFDAALVSAAVDAGAQLFAGATATVEPIAADATDAIAGRTIDLRYANGASGLLAAELVVVADGLGSPSLRRLSEFDAVTAPDSRIGFGLLPQPSLVSDGYEPSTLRMVLADDGYLGIARLADGRFCIGAAVDAAVARQHKLHQWIADAIARCGLPEIHELADAAIRGTRPLTRRPARTAGHRIFLLGDAAGYTEPITGEGMAWALAGAAALPPLAVAACRRWRPEFAMDWQRTLRQEVYCGQYVNRFLAAVLRRPRYARPVFAAAAAFPGFAAPVVRRLNRPQAVARIAA
ncbi:MAG: FAD-dependent monooxygenase [Planctomycetaceae bacterium]|nr:FAD-dependent monooxygenase [Planctomycetaceae bacterium]